MNVGTGIDEVEVGRVWPVFEALGHVKPRELLVSVALEVCAVHVHGNVDSEGGGLKEKLVGKLNSSFYCNERSDLSGVDATSFDCRVFRNKTTRYVPSCKACRRPGI